MVPSMPSCSLKMDGMYPPVPTGTPRLRYDLLCVEWDVKPYTLTPTGTNAIDATAFPTTFRPNSGGQCPLRLAL